MKDKEFGKKNNHYLVLSTHLKPILYPLIPSIYFAASANNGSSLPSVSSW